MTLDFGSHVPNQNFNATLWRKLSSWAKGVADLAQLGIVVDEV